MFLGAPISSETCGEGDPSIRSSTTSWLRCSRHGVVINGASRTCAASTRDATPPDVKESSHRHVSSVARRRRCARSREGLDKKRRDKIRLNMYLWDIALIDMLRHHREYLQRQQRSKCLLCRFRAPSRGASSPITVVVLTGPVALERPLPHPSSHVCELICSLPRTPTTQIS